jgi:hypothetical protein
MIKHFLLFLLFVQSVFGQQFVPVDDETLEFIPDVNYHLYAGHKEVLLKACENDRPTEVSASTQYDSIVFEKYGYKHRTIVKDSIKPEQVVLLVPEVFSLEEMVLTRQPKEISLGEKNRFFRRQNHPMIDHLDYALWIENPYGKAIKSNAFRFFVEKVKYKTAYKVLFYPYEPKHSHLDYYAPGDALFVSQTAYLLPNQKGVTLLDLKPTGFELPVHGMLASVELVGYFDTDGNPVVPEPDDRTMVKFQFSKQANYFTRTIDFYTREESEGLINMNARVNYDFAFHFFKKPHKSTLIAPAFFLEVTR